MENTRENSEENDKILLTLEVPKNGLMAAGEALLTASFSTGYGSMPAWKLAHRFEIATAHDNMLMVYEQGEKARICIGWILIAELSPTVAMKYQTRHQELSVGEMKSGDQIWVHDLCAPFGQFDLIKDLVFNRYKSHKIIHGITEGGFAVEMRNPHYKG